MYVCFLLWSISVPSFSLHLMSIILVLFCFFELNENKHSFISVLFWFFVFGFFFSKPQIFNICRSILSQVISSLQALLQSQFLTSSMNINSLRYSCPIIRTLFLEELNSVSTLIQVKHGLVRNYEDESNPLSALYYLCLFRNICFTAYRWVFMRRPYYCFLVNFASEKKLEEFLS